MNTGVEISDTQHWVEDQMIRGLYIFTKQDVIDFGLPIKDVSVNRSLQRRESKGTIILLIPESHRNRYVPDRMLSL